MTKAPGVWGVPRVTGRRGLTLVEVAVATVVMALLAYGVYSGSHSVTRVFRRDSTTLDRVAELTMGAERVAQEVRDARQIIFPVVDGPVTPFLILRNFEGQVVCYHYSPPTRHLRRTVLGLDGTPVPNAQPTARDLDGVRFSHKYTGLVWFGLFAAENTILTAAGRKTQ